MGAKPKAPQTFAQIKAKFRPRETTVPIVLAGDLAAEHAILEAELVQLAKSWDPSSLGEKDPRREIASRISELQKQMRESEVQIRLRALQGSAWSDLVAAHPGKQPKEVFNLETLPAAAIAACAVDPLLTPDEAAELLGMLSDGDQGVLFDAVCKLNTEVSKVPFSLTASAALYSIGAS
ncbi:hypothetical protein ACU686_40535 [Yinghuangia aomiensis]